MKKDKPFAVYDVGWGVVYEPIDHKSMKPYRHMTIYTRNGNFSFYPGNVKQLRKFIKALKKGLRRLEE